MRIFTLEEMFASGKEMGKGCVAVHTIGDFLFWMKNTTGLLSAQNFRRKRILFVRTRSSSLNWTIFFWGKSFHKRLCRRKIFKITERYAHLIICAILRKLGSVGRNVQCSYPPEYHFLSMMEGHVSVINKPRVEVKDWVAVTRYYVTSFFSKIYCPCLPLFGDKVINPSSKSNTWKVRTDSHSPQS